MGEHLRLLQEMFPGKIYLDEIEVGKLFGVSPLTILDKKYQKKLPFSICTLSTKFRVSIVELAKFMAEDKSNHGQGLISHPFFEKPKVLKRKSRSKLYKDQFI